MASACLITTAFETIAQSQRRALGYEELPYVMLEHPVAVATDEEVERKVGAAFSQVVRALAG
ncbi:MAG: hypothetical protein ACE5JJ_04890 [Nitrospinota bacterium]